MKTSKNKKKSESSAEILLSIANDKKLKGDITYNSILDKLGHRAFGIALLFFALPSALPFSAIPGVSTIFSIPIALFALQVIFRKKRLWLPKFLGERTVSHRKISQVIHKAMPYLKWIERFLRPRFSFMLSPLMYVITGIVIFILAIFLMIPIPFSNFIFAGLIMLFGLGLAEEDGLFILIAYLGAILYILIMYTFIFAGIKAIAKKF